MARFGTPSLSNVIKAYVFPPDNHLDCGVRRWRRSQRFLLHQRPLNLMALALTCQDCVPFVRHKHHPAKSLASLLESMHRPLLQPPWLVPTASDFWEFAQMYRAFRN